MRVVEIGSNIDYGGGVTHLSQFTGIVIEATREEIAALTENILYNEVTVKRVNPKPNGKVVKITSVATGVSDAPGKGKRK